MGGVQEDESSPGLDDSQHRNERPAGPIYVDWNEAPLLDMTGVQQVLQHVGPRLELAIGKITVECANSLCIGLRIALPPDRRGDSLSNEMRRF
jgi:hypothetical protein